MYLEFLQVLAQKIERLRVPKKDFRAKSPKTIEGNTGWTLYLYPKAGAGDLS